MGWIYFWLYGTTAMQPKRNTSIRALREIIGRTQSEFAAMVGASKPAVVSWETGRKNLSLQFAHRIWMATGADARSLLRGIGEVLDPAGRRPYTAQDFDRWRKEFRRTDDATAKRYTRLALDSLELIFLAASKPGAGKVKDRLPAAWMSFLEWLDQVVREFKLQPEIDALLRQRTFKDSLTLTYGQWREATGLAEWYGFKDNKRKPASESLTLEVESWPQWAAGGDMRPGSATVRRPV
jgi:DNA-binding XRE family transcriptional regulator